MNAKRKIAVLCGSTSDLAQIASGLAILRVAEAQDLITVSSVEVCSVHRNPDALRRLLAEFKYQKIDVVIACAGKLAALFGECDAISRNVMRNTRIHFVAVPIKGESEEANQAAYLSAKQVPNSQLIFKEEFFQNPEEAFEYAISGELPEIILEEQKPPQSFSLADAYHAGKRKYPAKASYDDLIYRLEQGGFIHIYTGKTRETFIDPDFPSLLYILATDRISIFDIVLNATIPDKGAILTASTIHWLRDVFHDVPNHLVAYGNGIMEYLPEAVRSEASEADIVYLMKNMIVTKRAKPLKVEAIARGNLTGSGLEDYKATGMVCGIELPAGLIDGSELPEIIFTPSTKADYGLHDENISFEKAVEVIGEKEAKFVRDMTLHLFLTAREKMRSSGIIIADTKFEFGVDSEGNMILIDEVLTPDSSRFWPEEGWKIAMAAGQTPPSFDKQPVRIAGKAASVKTNPGWVPSDDLIAQTSANYRHMIVLETDKTLDEFWRDDMGISE